MLDSDGSYSVYDISKLIEKLLINSDCEVIAGSRLKGKIEKGAMGKINYLGNLFLTFTAKILFGNPISDLCTGMWGFKKKVYSVINLNASHFELEADIYAEISKNNFKLCEIPINYKKKCSR